MDEPIITRDPMRMEEVWTQGKLTGITVILTYRHDENVITYTDTFHLPEEEQMWAEDWQAAKAAMGPGLVGLALEGLNFEYKMFLQLRDYIDSLPQG